MWKKIPDYLQHVIIAIAFMHLVMLLTALLQTHSWYTGAAFGIAMFYGREIRDVEIHNNWLDNWRVFCPWLWHYKDSLTDFLWPAGGCIVAALLWEIFT